MLAKPSSLSSIVCLYMLYILAWIMATMTTLFFSTTIWSILHTSTHQSRETEFSFLCSGWIFLDQNTRRRAFQCCSVSISGDIAFGMRPEINRDWSNLLRCCAHDEWGARRKWTFSQLNAMLGVESTINGENNAEALLQITTRWRKVANWLFSSRALLQKWKRVKLDFVQIH